MIQIVLETVAWTITACILVAPVLTFVMLDGEPGDHISLIAIAGRSLIVAAVTTIIGTSMGVLATREKHLFRYFKDR